MLFINKILLIQNAKYYSLIFYCTPPDAGKTEEVLIRFVWCSEEICEIKRKLLKLGRNLIQQVKLELRNITIENLREKGYSQRIKHEGKRMTFEIWFWNDIFFFCASFWSHALFNYWRFKREFKMIAFTFLN